MTTIKEIIARNIEKIEAVINGDVESAVVAGIGVYRVNFGGSKFYFETGGLRVYGDEIEALGCIAHLIRDGTTIAHLSLWGE